MLERQTTAQETKLREYDQAERPPKRKPLKRRSGPDEWQLKGAARPWTMLKQIEDGILYADGTPVHKPDYVDMFEPNRGEFWTAHEETKKYVEMLFQLGQACMGAGKSVRAIQCFLQCLELDAPDHQNVRQHLVSAFLDEGRTGEARALMDKYNTESNTVFAFSRLMTEYVAWHVLQETDASEVR